MTYTSYILHELEQVVIEPQSTFDTRDTYDTVANLAITIVSKESYTCALMYAKIHAHKHNYTITGKINS